MQKPTTNTGYKACFITDLNVCRSSRSNVPPNLETPSQKSRLVKNSLKLKDRQREKLSDVNRNERVMKRKRS